MPSISRSYFKAAVIFLLIGIAIGLQMSVSGKHEVSGAHAHLTLLGWVSMALFGTYFALEPGKAGSALVIAQFWVAVASTAIMIAALYLMLLGYQGLTSLVAGGSLGYAVAALLFAWIVFGPSAGDSAASKREATH